jgi:hypothetical protein
MLFTSFWENEPGSQGRLGHVFQLLQGADLDDVLGGLGSHVHQLARLEGVRDILLGRLGRLVLDHDLAETGDREGLRALAISSDRQSKIAETSFLATPVASEMLAKISVLVGGFLAGAFAMLGNLP